MSGNGERKKGTLRPDFNRRIKLDFQGATLSSDTGFLLLREIDERFGIIEEIAAGYEDCNDADFLRVDPALSLDYAADWIKNRLDIT